MRGGCIAGFWTQDFSTIYINKLVVAPGVQTNLRTAKYKIGLMNIPIWLLQDSYYNELEAYV